MSAFSWTHSLAKMLSGANAFEISNIQEAETEGALACLWRIVRWQ